MLEGSAISTDLNQKGEFEQDQSKKSLHLNLDESVASEEKKLKESV